MIERVVLSLTGTSGTTYSTSSVEGTVEYVKVAYTNGQVGGDLTVTDEESGQELLAITDSNTAFEGPLLDAAVGANGAAIANEYRSPVISGRVKAVHAQQAANTVVTLTLWIRH